MKEWVAGGVSYEVAKFDIGRWILAFWGFDMLYVEVVLESCERVLLIE